MVDFKRSLEPSFFGLMSLTKALAPIQWFFLMSRFLGHSQPSLPAPAGHRVQCPNMGWCPHHQPGKVASNGFRILALYLGLRRQNGILNQVQLRDGRTTYGCRNPHYSLGKTELQVRPLTLFFSFFNVDHFKSLYLTLFQYCFCGLCSGFLARRYVGS